MIDLVALTARAAPLAIAPLTVSLGPGLHALLGAPDDAVGLLLDVIAARVRPRSGELRIAGESPRAPASRRTVAYVPREVTLPDAMRVDEALALAAQVRDEPRRDATARLSPLGLTALAARTVRSLAPDEARGVALAEALTSSARVLLIDEPFFTLDPRAAAVVAAALRARAAAGACVVVATASVRDALDLADDVLTFTRGTLVRRAPATDPIATLGSGDPCLRAVVSDARALLAALAGEGAVLTVRAEPGAVVATGNDPIALAAAIGRAVVRSGVHIDMLQADTLPLEELRGAIAGDAAGAYRAAYDRARVAQPALPPATRPSLPPARPLE